MDVLSNLFGLLYIGIWLLILFTPFWFFGSMISLIFSEAQRQRIRARWFFYLIYGFVSAFVICLAWENYGPDLHYPTASEPFANEPLTRASVDQADAIVEGTFDLKHVGASSREILYGKYGPGLQVNCTLVPFDVAATVKGKPVRRLQVKLMFPVERRFALAWEMPQKEKLLLVLRRDPVVDDAYEILSQQTTWLVLARPHVADAPAGGTEKFVLDDAEGFLQACVDHPGLGGQIPYQFAVGNSFSAMGEEIAAFPQDDPARQHALQIGKELAGTDPAFIALAGKFQGEYGKVGDLANSIAANAGDTSFLEAGLKKYNSEPVGQAAPNGSFQVIGNNHYNFPWQVANAVRNADDPGKMLPLIQEALASPDPRMRREVMRALREWHPEGKQGSPYVSQLDKQFYPVIAKMLDDPDREVQYTTMGCLFEMSGCIKQPFGHRDLELWAIPIVKQNPELYVQQYRDWWQAHKAELGGGP